MTANNRTSLRIGSRVYEVDGKHLVCRDLRTQEECFRKVFSHPQYETLKDLGIHEVHVSPDGKDMILLFEPSPPGYKTVGNLARVAPTGQVVWWAELTDTGRDTYIAVDTSGGKIVAWSWGGYKCDIDPRMGRIVSKRFTK